MRLIHRRTTLQRRPSISAGGALAVACATALLLLSTPPTAARGQEEHDSAKAARGSVLFRVYCVSCHGRSAVGDGDIAEYLSVKPADLTRIQERNDGVFEPEAVERVIDGRTRVKTHFGSQMPVWGDGFMVADGGHTEEEVRERVEALTHYLWSLQK